MTKSTIAIVGGGLCGSMVAIQQMLNLITQRTLEGWTASPKSTIDINIFDTKNAIGYGTPYMQEETTQNVFLLNQPAYAMSPLQDIPNHFSDWLKLSGKPFSENDFAPRELYGSYINDVFSKAADLYEQHGIGKISHIKSTIKDIEKISAFNFKLTDDQDNTSTSNVIVLTPGHGQSDLLNEHSYHPLYFSAPYDNKRAHERLSYESSPILIIGTSQSMLDGLALLDHIQHQGPVYAISRNLVKPWRFDPIAERSEFGEFCFENLNARILSKPSALSSESLRFLFEQDLENGLKKGIATGHILSSFHASQLEKSIGNDVTKKNFASLSSYVSALYGNPTSPQRYELMEKYESTGKLIFVRGDIQKAHIKATKDGFSIQFDHHQKMNVSSIFNSASYTMKTISDDGKISIPLLDRLDMRGALRRSDTDKNAFESGSQNWNGLYLAGPATNSQRWGVGTFKKSISNIAHLSTHDLKTNLPMKPL
ncbi:FAD/NAD(P)-binding protein [Micavibrio aeruginosavorus]|uniref:FAD/NAD(P)-binding protein n=1 Tax=Micavibrio aeruginosavorus TaxID=349221 RepID=UPI003F4AEEB3